MTTSKSLVIDETPMLRTLANPPARPVDPSDTANRINNQRNRRLASGGRNATFMSAAVADAAGAVKPTATLTGLS